MKVAIGGDHAGYKLKEKLKDFISELGHDVKDFGPSSEESCDYPDIAHPIAKSVKSGENNLGIAICGSANGINMTLNKHAGIRSAIAWNNELASLARQHNDANILALPARFIDIDTAKEAVKTFLETEFEGGRHQRRVDKIDL
ncbi:MAG: ribose 5-phosphate isomerase B [Flavobacteriales bacterium]|nr:ribose 5-phosphate isomerase B [Flavobacteriales bacterium]|tara:strand:- start:3342 stop:3770 length:429 start_codon:yes stop_codon:yes gene_type:complete